MSKVTILGTTFSTTEDKKVLFNAGGSPTGIVKDLVGKEIKIAHVVSEVRTDDKSGEEFTRCILIDELGHSFMVSSEPFITRLEDLLEAFGNPSQDEPLAIKVRNQKSASSEYSYLTLDLA